ncbi:reverse transcriptase domain-containing protein, partial [Bosea sp. (in: a-proteobacteria)]|uniref:reverse transcriptase domain-containing protein n=1 Tax=Bosea sp. (in: a-proteobacteria) TaxID=1871050 RepID=UPI0040337E48
GFMPAGTVGAGGGDGAAASAGGDGGGASAAEVNSLRRSARLSQQQPEYGSLAAAMAEAPAASVWVPRTIQEARASPLAEQWAMATDAEMESLLSYGTWELVPSPPGCRPLANRWVFSVKEDSKGNKRFKARLVVKGYLQREGVDFTELHAPVSKHATVRALLAVAAAADMELEHLDVMTAFLNGWLHEEIYMQQPAGYEDGTARVCRLRRALYGLRQAPRAWHARLKAELEQLGFVASEADSCLFTMVRGNSKVLLAVYVDDCLLAVSKGDTATVAWVKEQLAAVFNIHQLGSAERFLGMEISRDRAAGQLVLSQERYATSVVDRFGLADSKPRSVPLSTSEQLVREGEVQPHMGGHSYAELVGSLMHLAVCTRPDIAQAVGVCAKYMAAPTAQHWHALRGVLRYVADSRAEGLVFGAAEGLVGFCDADFAGDTDTRRSTTGYVFMLHGGAVSWSSRRQPTVAVSTTEAEYMAASAASKEALWLRTLVAELAVGSDVVQPVTIMCDNEAAITLIKHPIASAQSKHIDVLHHFVRERAARGEVVFKFCESEANVADGMTKALPRAKFEFCKTGMGMV